MTAEHSHDQEKDMRDIKTAIWNGVRHRCPNCGTGPLYRAYLKTRDHCAVCGEELYHHRADDGPAYLTILVAGHIMAPLILIVWELFRPQPIVMAVGFTLLFCLVALWLLPRFKGMIVGIQWAKRMYGFDDETTHPAE